MGGGSSHSPQGTLWGSQHTGIPINFSHFPPQKSLWGALPHHLKLTEFFSWWCQLWETVRSWRLFPKFIYWSLQPHHLWRELIWEVGSFKEMVRAGCGRTYTQFHPVLDRQRQEDQAAGVGLHYTARLCIKKPRAGSGQMAQWVEVLATKSSSPSSIPGSHTLWRGNPLPKVVLLLLHVRGAKVHLHK